MSGGLDWSGRLGMGRVRVWFGVGAPYGSALVAMATRDCRRRMSGFERWGTMAAYERGDGSEAWIGWVVRAAGLLARTG